MPNIKYKYKPGNRLYYLELKSVPTLKECIYCKGTGVINKEIRCQVCDGKGQVETGSGSIEEIISSGIVNQVSINIWLDEDNDNTVRIHYTLDNGNNQINKYEGQLFKTEEEVEKTKVHGCMGYTK